MLLNLSFVTQSLQNLLKYQIVASPAWPGGALTVSSLPPDRLKDVGDCLSIYLFHLAEEPSRKNSPGASADAPPVRYTPMGLQLTYILTAYSAKELDAATYFEQLVMGLGVKTLRDTPMIDDTTFVGPNQVLAPGLRNLHNRFRLTLEPVTSNDAPHYWTAGQQPLRLAAYYQANATLLEPWDAGSYAPPVLQYGVFSLLRGGPRIDTTVSTVTYVTPDGVTHQADMRPAEAAVGQNVSLLGSALRGDAATVTLSNPFWPAPVDADAAWAVKATDTRVTFTVRNAIGPGLPPQTVAPGNYTVHVTTTERRTLPDGRVRDFDKVSNEAPFAVVPTATASALDPQHQGTITGGLFADPVLVKADAVQVLFGFDLLTAVPPPGPPLLAPGTFTVQDSAHIRFRVPASALSGDARLLRVFVNGVESAPQWVTVP
jgi:hypothetical protein